MKICIDAEDLQFSYNHFFTTATKEAEMYNNAEKLDKISVKSDGIRFHKSRIMEGQRFVLAGGLEDSNSLNELSINILTPLVDRYSPLSYSIADYIHRVVCKHAGLETCCRSSLNFCYIIGALSLFQELGEDCVTCAKRRKKFMEAAMGPTPPTAFSMIPPFWVTMGDMAGPFTVYVPGRERETRRSKSLDCKVWVMAFVCPTTKLVNLQVMEEKTQMLSVVPFPGLAVKLVFPPTSSSTKTPPCSRC